MSEKIKEIDWIQLPHRIYGRDDDGRVICEITFPETAPGVCTIESTFVNEDYRGKGLAGKLVAEAIELIKSRGEKVEAECPYAKTWIKDKGFGHNE
ncbi:MAG: N-acetyltransferase [Lachnospiraceae bacterium]|nr:N-acetyltransferase [Lachnospiraceae bacterium]